MNDPKIAKELGNIKDELKRLNKNIERLIRKDNCIVPQLKISFGDVKENAAVDKITKEIKEMVDKEQLDAENGGNLVKSE